jgi:phosphatidylinositol alpha-1,6-mannosyltransferase
MAPGRGLFELVQAVDLARRSAPDLVLVLLGGGSSVDRLRALVSELGIQDHVRFIGPTPHDRVPEFLGACRIGVVPWPASWDMEVNWPVKMAEYLSFGLPAVLTDIVPHRIVPADASFVFWAPTGSPRDLADAILAAYGRRDDLAKLGRQAADWAGSRLTWSAQFQILEGVLAPDQRCGSPGPPSD